MARAIILMLDSVGIGSAPDAAQFGDAGANTLGHIAAHCAQGKADNANRQGALHIPNLTALGIGHACRDASGEFPQGLDENTPLIGAYAHAAEISTGKDTPSGHWEMAGVPVRFEWGYFPKETDTFPPDLLERIITRAGIPDVLGNCRASGTEIIARLGEEHMQSGKPIVYTSVDSVFQIAAHEETFGLQKLYDLCEIAFEELDGMNIGRVIARPFTGDNPGNFKRTGNRHDYAIKPPKTTILQKIIDEAKGEVHAVGKIADIYANTGISHSTRASGLEQLFDTTLAVMDRAPANSLIFTNFVDFDSEYGHRRDVAGYAGALEYFDRRLPELLQRLRADDLLIITADHGNDPTWHGTEHIREYVPILLYGDGIPAGKNYGRRQTFADIAQTLAKRFGTSAMDDGTAIC